MFKKTKSLSLLVLIALLLTLLTGNIFTASAEGKKVAVVEFNVKVTDQWWGGSYDVGRGMSDMLITALVKAKKFSVFEREQLESVLKEQNLGLSGAVDASTAAEIGKLIGLDYIITGNVSEFGVDEIGGSTGWLGGLGLKQTTAKVTVDARIIDCKTAQIVNAVSGHGEDSTMGGWSGKLDVDFSNESDWNSSIIGKASRQAVDQLVSNLVTSFPTEGYIVSADPKEIIINLGKVDGMAVGMQLDVKRKGKAIIDPKTKKVLKVKENDIGVIEITSVDDTISYCKIVSGSSFKEEDQVYPKK